MKASNVYVEEIGRQRFAAELPRLRAIVRGCSFVAIDTEMGGLSLQDCRPGMMDSLEERYAQLRASAQQFPIVQFGLSCFTWDATAQRFDVTNFQFPIFPRFVTLENSGGNTNELPDRRFLVQPRCLQYIRDHGFDLNAWIDDGVSYLSHAEQVRYSDALTQSTQPDVLRKFDPNVPAVVTADTRTFLTDMTKRITTSFAAQGVRLLNPKSTSGGSVTNKQARRRTKHSDRRKQQPHQQCRSTSKDSSSDNNNDGGEDDVAAGAVRDTPQRSAGSTLDMIDRKPTSDAAAPADSASSNAAFVHTTAELHAARVFLDSSVAAVERSELHNRSSASASDTYDWRDAAVFVTEPLAPFRRHVLLQHVASLGPHVVALDCRIDNSSSDANAQQSPWKRRVRLVATTSAKHKHCLLAAAERIAQQEVDDRNIELVGFTALVDVLACARKPLIGHNALLDVMQVFETFYKPLPLHCAAFLHDLHAWLCGGTDDVSGGGLYDTKQMVTHATETLDAFAAHILHSALETVYDALCKTPFHGAAIRIVGPDDTTDAVESPLSAHDDSMNISGAGATAVPLSVRNKPRVQAHQAGYDAFMTGVVFLRVSSGLGIPNSALAALGGGGSSAIEDSSSSTNAPSTSMSSVHARLLPFRNVLHVSHFLPLQTTLRLPGPFPRDVETPSRACFVRLDLMRNAAAAQAGGRVRTFHIQRCVNWVLALPAATAKHVYVHWAGKHTAYVALPTPALAEKLVRVRAATPACVGSAADPLPSIGCVDIYRCERNSNSTSNSNDEKIDLDVIAPATATLAVTPVTHKMTAMAMARAADDDVEFEAEQKQPKRRK